MPDNFYWALLDLLYEYLDDGYKFTAQTDVPCHLWCRMTTIEPQKHIIPSGERGTYLTGKVRFCFVVYEDNEQDEAGDTLIHTFYKHPWQVCVTKWFYFIGTIGGVSSPSETAIFQFHFPAPPPAPPPPLTRLFLVQATNASIRSTHVDWPTCRAGASLENSNWQNPPTYGLYIQAALTASFWCIRSFLTFQTQTLPPTFKPTSAKLWINTWFKQCTSAVAYPYMDMTPGVHHDPVILADWYSQTNLSTLLGRHDIRTFNLFAYNSIDFLPDKLDFILASAPTKLCLRQEMDRVNQRPFLGNNQVAYYSQQKGIGYRPYLEVNYYPAIQC